MRVIFALTLITMTTSISPDCIQLYSTPGHKLAGHQYKQFSCSDLIQCFTECRQHGDCQSINYKLMGSMCELNNRTREAHPFDFRTADYWVYFNNPFRNVVGSSKSIPGKSCKEIRDNSPGEDLASQEYWINPGNLMHQPFSVFCDMNTDGGGWTLIANTVVGKDNTIIGEMLRTKDYRAITNYTTNTLRVDVPTIRQLRNIMGFSQLRYFCSKKSVGRTFHVITKKNILGENVVKYFTEEGKNRTQSCDSYFRGPGDNSVLAANCEKWGNNGSSIDIGKWGYFEHHGEYRIYNEPAYWDGNFSKYFVNFIPGRLCCDEDKNTSNPLSAGDFWKLFVR